MTPPNHEQRWQEALAKFYKDEVFDVESEVGMFGGVVYDYS